MWGVVWGVMVAGKCDPRCVPLQPMRIHISEATAELLQGTNFVVEERGRVEVKVCCYYYRLYYRLDGL